MQEEIMSEEQMHSTFEEEEKGWLALGSHFTIWFLIEF